MDDHSTNQAAVPVKQLLPKFAKPPVIEVALSVQFDRLDLNVVRMGLVWQRFRDRFPNVAEKPEINAAFERFGLPEKVSPGIHFETIPMPIPRLWFIDKQGNELVQIQRDRFIRNWRKLEGNSPYPAYETLRSAFVNDWGIFSKFMSEEYKSPLAPNQCEVTYVNIVESADSSQLAGIISRISGSCSDDFLGDPESEELTLRYVLQGESQKPWGRLYITTTPAIRETDGKPVVRLSLNVRGVPETQDTDGVLGCLDKGHEAIVRGFTSITTTNMHKKWERVE